MILEFRNGKIDFSILQAMLDNSQIEYTFADENDIFIYFNDPKERIFTRNTEIIGTNVRQCHSPKSQAALEILLSDFRSHKRTEDSYWLYKSGKAILIKYIAVYDKEGKYLGCLETAQAIPKKGWKYYLRVLKGKIFG